MKIRRFITPMVFLIIISFLFWGIEYLKERYERKASLNVLMLHVVTDKMTEDRSLGGLYITADCLKEYLKYFIDNGYNIVGLNDAYDIFVNNLNPKNPKLLSITFDDGYVDSYTLAYPILKEFNVKANINVISGFADEEKEGYLTWSQIKDMSDSGLIEIGSHSYYSHYYVEDYKGDGVPLLKALLPGETSDERKKRIFNDLEKSDNKIAEIIGKKTNILAYPYGVPPFDLKEEITKKFDYNIELMVRQGVNREIDDFKELYRFTVNGNEKPVELEKRMLMYNGLKFIDSLTGI